MRLKRRSLLLVISGLLGFPAVAQPISPFHYSATKAQTFNQAAVASAHPLASQVGATIMKQGGNAFDAAIATQLALAVVFPVAGNLGGGGFMVARTASGQNLALDFREKAPALATANMYQDASGQVIKGQSLLGPKAAGVPGTVAGLVATLPYGRLSLAKLIAPAIALAQKGFAITEQEAEYLNKTRAEFLQYSSKSIALAKPLLWKVGDTLRQPELAQTMKRIAKHGTAGFYAGQTARLIVEEMKRGGGLITLKDLSSYRVRWRKALVLPYKSYTVVGMPPPSSGGVLVGQMLKMIEQRPLASYGWQSGRAMQLMAEAERRAFADRAQHLGDPDFWNVPLRGLLDSTYLAKRMADYDSTRPTPSSAVAAGQPSGSEQTTHLCVADKFGNVISITTTLNDAYGCKAVVGGAGFLLNNEMDDFSSKPGVPNMYGAIGGQANAIAPGKRMLSSMAPTLVLKGGKPYLACGSPGGTTIPTTVFQLIVNVLEFGLAPSEAVGRPRFHHQWLPDTLYVEKACDPTSRAYLLGLGYVIKQRRPIGRAEILRLNEKGQWEAAADPRGDDSVAGF